jgi:hypothetical protein
VRIWPPVEQPCLGSPGRWLDLQEGSSERVLGSVAGYDHVLVPANAQVDRAFLYLLPIWGEGFAHMLRLCEYVENEFDRSVKLSNDENFGITRKFDDCRPVAISCTATLFVVVTLWYSSIRSSRSPARKPSIGTANTESRLS